jgi:hypothetical protein
MKQPNELFLYIQNQFSISVVQREKCIYLWKYLYKHIGVTLNKKNKINKKDIVKDCIAFPSSFLKEEEYFPIEIKKKIIQDFHHYLMYQYNLNGRLIHIYFFYENKKEEKESIEIIQFMISWLEVMNSIFILKNCANKLSIFFYYTHFEKKMNEMETMIFSPIHVNSAFTEACNPISQITIYRSEEWRKVFIHETFHTFGIDFSENPSLEGIKKIKMLFPLYSSKWNIFEGYTEFWAEIFNIAFHIFFKYSKITQSDFCKTMDLFVEFEKKFSLFQMVKILSKMNLTYEALTKKNHYQENTNVFSYYIIKTILLYNHIEFLNWCIQNNELFFHSKKTESYQHSFVLFIQNNYKNKNMLDEIKMMENIHRVKRNQSPYIQNTLRMSLFG